MSMGRLFAAGFRGFGGGGGGGGARGSSSILTNGGSSGTGSSTGGALAAKSNAAEATSIDTGTTQRALPLLTTVSSAWSSSPGRLGTLGMVIGTVATLPTSFALPTSSHGTLLVPWANTGRFSGVLTETLSSMCSPGAALSAISVLSISTLGAFVRPSASKNCWIAARPDAAGILIG